MYNTLYEFARQKAKHTIWVFSDLQQAKFENTKRCLEICMEDYELLGKPADMIWYLGDSTEGSRLDELYRMTELQEKAFSSLDIPLCYTTGNHDYDYPEYCRRNNISDISMPFYEMVQHHPGWYTTSSCEETWFKVPVGDYMAYFFCDHIARDNSWCSTHNRIRYGGSAYPYGDSHFADIRKEMENCEKPHIITAAHCAFPGGNRDTDLLGKIQPLPLNVHLHLYGHSHIGEYTCPQERVFSQIQWVDWQDIPQVDVASFENIRGS
ncbi:MAG: metallophosphoesterase, partial [Parasporobacterium sp.]|nr:metallophosphoesterase [Parasporobacterium sp.]